MTEDERQLRKQKIVKAVMFGLMTGSGIFLAERYLLKLDSDISLIVATFFAVAVGMHLLQQVDKV